MHPEDISGDLDAGFLQEAAVNADLTELVFDQHQLFALEGLRQQLLDEGRLTGTQKPEMMSILVM